MYVLLPTQVVIHIIHIRESVVRETTTRKSPNDASGVVWSLGGSFFLSFSMFLILMYVYCIYRL